MKTISNYWLYMLFLTSMLAVSTFSTAQRLSYESKTEIALNNGLNIILYKSLEGDKYYYLPPSESIHLGKRPDKTPEFLFVKYTSDKRAGQGGAQGALLHFLLEWGLTPTQFKELETKLAEKTNSKSTLAGPVDLEAGPGESFRIVSAVLSNKSFTSQVLTSGMAPPMPGAKAAVATHLDANGAQLLDATFRKSRSITDVSVVLDYEYTTLVKAAKGLLKYELDINQSQGDGIAYDLIKKELDKQPELYQKAIDHYNKNKKLLNDECGVGDGLTNVLIGLQAIDNVAGNTSGKGDTGSPWEYGLSEQMMRKVYDHFTSMEYITMEWEETVDDERLEVIREAFFDYFLNAFTDPDYPEIANLNDGQPNITLGDEAIKNSAQGGYRFKSCSQLNASRTLRKTIKLDKIILPVRRRYQMVTNLASTYDQVKNNPNCVIAVNLNDPFFQHRDINFILDVEAMDIFKEEINYVTVHVRKRRSEGLDFVDDITISPEAMASKGRLATLSYARGEDRNADVYQYKAQWSLRGGYLYPENPGWQNGDWQAVTLAPPILPRAIEFEADLEQLKEKGIRRASLQLRYQKYGREYESTIPLTVSKNQPLVEQRIYVDRDRPGYAYRLILTHEQYGKMATNWEAKINDDYVFARLPENWGDNRLVDKMIRAARELVPNSTSNKEITNNTERVLDKVLRVVEGFIQN